MSETPEYGELPDDDTRIYRILDCENRDDLEIIFIELVEDDDPDLSSNHIHDPNIKHWVNSKDKNDKFMEDVKNNKGVLNRRYYTPKHKLDEEREKLTKKDTE